MAYSGYDETYGGAYTPETGYIAPDVGGGWYRKDTNEYISDDKQYGGVYSQTYGYTDKDGYNSNK